MAEYIEREAALDIFGDVPMWNGYFEPYPWEVHCAIVGTTKLVKEEIRKIPAADVAPVRHGRWVHTDLAAHWYGKDECSECTYHEHDRRDLSHFNYCPNCGAKMEE